MYYSIKKGDRLGYSRVKSWFMDIRAIARMAHCSGAGGRQGADTLQFSEQKYPYKAIKSMTVTCSEYDTGIVNSSHCTGNSGNFKLSSSSFNPHDNCSQHEPQPGSHHDNFSDPAQQPAIR